MRKGSIKHFVILLLLISFTAAGCSVFKGGNKGCGCPSKKGMVGY